MHQGEYIGKYFEEQKTKILILGESHHGDESEIGKPRERGTSDVVNDYLRAKKEGETIDRAWYFFTKIAHAFDASLNCSQTIEFWEKVAFGNYVDVCCAKGKKIAEESIRDNQDRFNKELFQFVNDKGIDIIVCFSTLVFNSLPNTSIVENNSGVKILKYPANDNFSLNKELDIYGGIPHPSSRNGFKPIDYNPSLKPILLLLE